MFTQNILYLAIILLSTLTIHEAAHALAAYLLGDETAKKNGRLSLNPLQHLDPWGTILFILVGFGWGKPVPVNPIYFKNPQRDQALTALAGPASNLLMAFIAGIFIPYFPQTIFLAMFYQINITLAVFNLLPFPPLDGSKIVGIFLNDNQFQRYQAFIHNYSAYIIIGLFVDLFVLPEIINFSFLHTIIQSISAIISAVILIGNS